MVMMMMMMLTVMMIMMPPMKRGGTGAWPGVWNKCTLQFCRDFGMVGGLSLGRFEG